MPDTNVSAKSNRINISKAVFAPVTSNTSAAYTAGAVKDFGAVMSVTLTPQYATGKLYGRGIKTEDISKLTGMTVQMEINKIAIEILAEIYGYDFTTGVLTKTADDKPKEIAFGFEVESTNGKEYCWLFSGKAQPFGNTYKQSEDNITFSTDTLTIEFVPRELDKAVCKCADTANPAFTTGSTFLATVPA